jgi:N-acyl-D-amino-acid deacylase
MAYRRRPMYLTRALVALAAVGLSPAFAAGPQQYDVIIRDGVVVDGTGSPRYQADIGIIGAHIVAVGDLKDADARSQINARGLFVSPGFINIHGHPTAEGMQYAENMLLQGVTTELFNPDGGMAGPTGTDGPNLDAQLAKMSERGLGTNIAGYIGFNSVWQSVVGTVNRRATPDEIQRMRELITRNLASGAFGVSAGLDYKPGYYATAEEVIAVVSVAKPWRTNFPNHERITPETNFSSRVGIAETISIAESAGLAPVVTHIKAQGREQGKGPEIVEMLHKSAARGHSAFGDVYPYLAGQSTLAQLTLPAWALDGGRSAMLERFRDPKLRAQIAAEAERALLARFGSPKSVFLPEYKQRLDEVAGAGVSPGEAVIGVLEKSDAGAVLHFGAEPDLITFLKDPAIAVACDCGSINKAPAHPRYVGTFPRVLGHYAREQQVMGWEEAIRKMSGLPASIIGIVDRGFIAPGMAADITLFDPKNVIDRATFEQPALPSEGIRYVLVNGRLAVKDGRVTREQGGVALRRTAQMPTRPMSAGLRSVVGETELRSATGSGLPAAPLRIKLSLTQAPDARHAQGQLRIYSDNGDVLTISDFGILQTAPEWASFTGYARRSGASEAVTVIVDAANPLSTPRTTALTIQGANFGLTASLPAGAVAISSSQK